MKHASIIRSGIAGTIWMSFYMSIASHLFKKEMNIVKILGHLNLIKPLKNVKCKENIQGIILHYGIGILFAYNYRYLWKNNILESTVKNGALLGLVKGLITAVGWKPFLSLLTRPPRTSNKIYLTNLLVAHVVFGIATTLYSKKHQIA